MRLLVLERLKAELEAQLADVRARIQEVKEGIRRESRRDGRSLARKGQPPTSGSRGSAKGASKATPPREGEGGAHEERGAATAGRSEGHARREGKEGCMYNPRRKFDATGERHPDVLARGSQGPLVV